MPGELRYDFSTSGILAAIVALGTTERAVATNLFGEGIRGRRGQECDCPLANYLKAVVKGATEAFIYQDDEGLLYIIVKSGTEQVACVVGGPAKLFVVRFDLGHHSRLEATDVAA